MSRISLRVREKIKEEILRVLFENFLANKEEKEREKAVINLQTTVSSREYAP